MIRNNVSGHSPYEATTGFSRAVRIGPHIWTAGTAPIAADGSTAYPGDPFLQARHCLEIIKAAIERAGGTLEDVVQTQMFITDSSFADAVAQAHGEAFSEIRPAATMVVVKELLRPDWTVEIEAQAYVLEPE